MEAGHAEEKDGSLLTGGSSGIFFSGYRIEICIMLFLRCSLVWCQFVVCSAGDYSSSAALGVFAEIW